MIQSSPANFILPTQKLPRKLCTGVNKTKILIVQRKPKAKLTRTREIIVHQKITKLKKNVDRTWFPTGRKVQQAKIVPQYPFVEYSMP